MPTYDLLLRPLPRSRVDPLMSGLGVWRASLQTVRDSLVHGGGGTADQRRAYRQCVDAWRAARADRHQLQRCRVGASASSATVRPLDITI